MPPCFPSVLHSASVCPHRQELSWLLCYSVLYPTKMPPHRPRYSPAGALRATAAPLLPLTVGKSWGTIHCPSQYSSCTSCTAKAVSTRDGTATAGAASTARPADPWRPHRTDGAVLHLAQHLVHGAVGGRHKTSVQGQEKGGAFAVLIRPCGGMRWQQPGELVAARLQMRTARASASCQAGPRPDQRPSEWKSLGESSN